jgi:anti-sigma factor RsiW
MNCPEADELLGAYHDRELDVVRSRDLEAHLRGCAQCSADLERLETLRSVVAAKAPYYSAPAGLRSKLAAELSPREPRFSKWFALWPALAAASLLLALAVWRMAPAPGPQLVANEVVSAHVRSLLAEHLMDVPSTDRHTVKPWFAGKLDFAPDVQDLSAAGFTLVGGRLDYLDGRTVAALVYRRRQHTINVFTWPSGRGDETPRRESRQGFNLVHWVRHGMNWWAVSDLAGDELGELPVLLSGANRTQ